MEHWRSVLPGGFYESDYELLVADQETASRRLLSYCGLEWDPACIDFHEHKRDVKTASNWQVRQPIYTSSTRRWERYEGHLQPLLDMLGDLIREKHQQRQ